MGLYIHFIILFKMVRVIYQPPPFGPRTSLSCKAYGPNVTAPWLIRLSKMPHGQVMVGAVCFSLAICSIPQLMFEEIPLTCKPEYQAASRAYMRYHNMNPIWGISSNKGGH